MHTVFLDTTSCGCVLLRSSRDARPVHCHQCEHGNSGFVNPDLDGIGNCCADSKSHGSLVMLPFSAMASGTAAASPLSAVGHW